jgi:hypothetical protein
MIIDRKYYPDWRIKKYLKEAIAVYIRHTLRNCATSQHEPKENKENHEKYPEWFVTGGDSTRIPSEFNLTALPIY